MLDNEGVCQVWWRWLRFEVNKVVGHKIYYRSCCKSCHQQYKSSQARQARLPLELIGEYMGLKQAIFPDVRNVRLLAAIDCLYESEVLWITVLICDGLLWILLSESASGNSYLTDYLTFWHITWSCSLSRIKEKFYLRAHKTWFVVWFIVWICFLAVTVMIFRSFFLIIFVGDRTTCHKLPGKSPMSKLLHNVAFMCKGWDGPSPSKLLNAFLTKLKYGQTVLNRWIYSLWLASVYFTSEILACSPVIFLLCFAERPWSCLNQTHHSC